MDIQIIPLDQLKVWDGNVRHHKIDRIDRLAASIQEVGLLNPLTVVPNGTGYNVIAGQRRLRALQQIDHDGDLDKVKGLADGIPCHVRATEDMERISFEENTEQLPLHAVDVYLAVKSLIDAGESPDRVMAHYDWTHNQLAQIMRLAILDPKVLQHYADDEISGETCQALTLTLDHQTQLDMLEKFGDQPWRIRNELSQTVFKVKDALYDEQEYVDAGGEIVTDLFGEDSWFKDKSLALDIQKKVFDAQIAQARKDGWSFVKKAPKKFLSVRSWMRHYDFDEADTRSDLDYGESPTRPDHFKRADVTAKYGVYWHLDNDGVAKIWFGWRPRKEKKAEEQAKKAAKVAEEGPAAGGMSLWDEQSKAIMAIAAARYLTDEELILLFCRQLVSNADHKYGQTRFRPFGVSVDWSAGELGSEGWVKHRFGEAHEANLKESEPARQPGYLDVREGITHTPELLIEVLGAWLRDNMDAFNGNLFAKAIAGHVPNLREVYTPDESYFSRLKISELEAWFQKHCDPTFADICAKKGKAAKVALCVKAVQEPENFSSGDKLELLKAWMPDELKLPA